MQVRILCLSQARHVAVTQEIRDFERLPSKKCFVIPNGYFRKENNLEEDKYAGDHAIDFLNEIQTRLLEERKKGNKILIFVGSGKFPWHGIERIADLVEKLPSVFLLIVGDTADCEKIKQLQLMGRVLVVGFIDPNIMPRIYRMVDFGIGTFALDKKLMTQACPLKVREYLWYGLPV
ncbi:MAG: hypothetical protein QXU75_09565, partial [Candidatus Methanomethylicaceae archaeon]